MGRRKLSNLKRQVTTTEIEPGVWQAFVRHRDSDGVVRRVTARAESPPLAEEALELKLKHRVIPARRTGRPHSEVTNSIRAEHTVREAAASWLAMIDQSQDHAPTTKDNYRRVVVATINERSGIGSLPIGTVSAGEIKRHLDGIHNGTLRLSAELRKKSGTKDGPAPTQAKNFKKVMRQILAQAVLDGARSDNPVLNLPRAKPVSKQPRALKLAQVDDVRGAVAKWLNPARSHTGGRPRDPIGQLRDVLETLIGTGARIGEVLALRPDDCVLDVPAPFIKIRGTVVTVKGIGTYRQGFPKTSASVREIAIPPFVAEALERQIAHQSVRHAAPVTVFATSRNTVLQPNNVRRNLRAALDQAGLGPETLSKLDLAPVTPHAFRRTLATALGAERGSEQLGHADEQITKAHYIEPERHVVDNATLIQAAFGPAAEEPNSVNTITGARGHIVPSRSN